METRSSSDTEAKGCNFRWKIANFNNSTFCFPENRMFSPLFIANALRSKWSLELYKTEVEDECFIGFRLHRECKRPGVLNVSYEVALLSEKGSRLKTKKLKSKEFPSGYMKFVNCQEFFHSKRSEFLSEDTLNVLCNLWTGEKKPKKFDHLFQTTFIEKERRCFLWKIDRPLDNIIERENKFYDNLIDFVISLNPDLTTLCLKGDLVHDSVYCMRLAVSIIVPEERKEIIGQYSRIQVLETQIEFPIDRLTENTRKYFPNDALSIHLEFTLYTFEHSDHQEYSATLKNGVVEINEFQTVDLLINHLDCLYNDETFKDIELRTKTKIFKAHKVILSARSNKFRENFSNDKLESTPEYEDINDFEDDTVEEMLVYIYTGVLKDPSFEKACKLLAIAKVYGIPTLIRVCCAFLESIILSANVCKILAVAVEYKDGDLKLAVEKYILPNHKEIFLSKEWKDLMERDPETATDVMCRIISKID